MDLKGSAGKKNSLCKGVEVGKEQLVQTWCRLQSRG